MSETTKRRWLPLLIRALIGICAVVLAERLRLAIVLYGWENGWSIGMVWVLSLTPIAILAIVGYLIWRHRRNQLAEPPATQP